MRSKRRYLIAVSLTVHLVVVLALFVAGFWRIDRLDSPGHRFDLAVQGAPSPAPAGGLDKQVEKFKKKQPKEEKTVVKELTQILKEARQRLRRVDRQECGHCRRHRRRYRLRLGW